MYYDNMVMTNGYSNKSTTVIQIVLQGIFQKK